jgi:hypothetical protein
MEKKRKQTSLDAFITRTRVVTSSDGTVRSERIITEDIIFQKIDEDMLHAIFFRPTAMLKQKTSITTKTPPQTCQKSRPVMLISQNAYL